MAREKFTGTAGLPLARRAVRMLKDRGIYAHSVVSVEHQQLAQRYVLRGLESGGSAGDVARYVTFADEDGQPLEYLHPVEAIGANGLHAVVISVAFVRVDMLRKERTYELLITLHSLSSVTDGRRPQLETGILFRGIHGRVELDLSGKDKARAGHVLPTFYSLAGEVIAIPESSCRWFALRQKVSIALAVLTRTICASLVPLASRASTIQPFKKLSAVRRRRR